MTSSITIPASEMAKFNRTLGQYMLQSKRDMPKILNTKGFFIARRAVIETPKADYSKMARELGQLVTLKRSRKGKYSWASRGLGHINNAAGGTAPLLALIINRRRGNMGLPGLYGEEMREEFRHIWATRAKSIAFLKSGWIPAIKRLQPLADKAGAPKQETGVKQIGAAKGSADPAVTGWIVKCIIENRAQADHDFKDALARYGFPALRRAFEFERRSMIEYMERKQLEAARKFGIKVGRV